MRPRGLFTRRTLALFVGLASFAALPVQAGGFHISILGVRRTGMMTNLAAADDVTALFHNPAALADLPGTQLHLSSGLTFLDTAIQLQALDPVRFPEVNPPDCGTASGPACDWPVNARGYYRDNIGPERYLGIIPYLGVSQNLGSFFPGLADVTVSGALYAPGAYGAFLPKRAPTAYYVVEGLFVVAAATVGAGWRVNDKLAVGANFSYNYMRLGYAQKFSTIDLFTDLGAEPDLTAQLAHAALGDLRLDYAGTDQGGGVGLAVLFTPWRSLALAAGAHVSTAARFEGTVKLRGLGSRLTGSGPTDADALASLARGFGYKLPKRLEVEMPIPPVVQAGVNYTPWPWLELGFDTRWWLYSVFDEQVLRPIYARGDTGEPPLTEENLSKDKGYHDSFEVAAGVLVRPFDRLPELELMAGVAFDRSPVPDRTFSIDNPSLNQLIFSGGIRSRLGEHWRAGLGYMLISYLERDIRTSETWPPTNACVSGRSHIPTLEVEARW